MSIKDAPARGRKFLLEIVKRRFWCKPCLKPFTEPVSGISMGKRPTERYRRHLLWACEKFSDLKAVKKEMGCSTSIADKFHVIRLLHPSINRMRKGITGDIRTFPIRRLLLKDSKKIEFFTRNAIHRWLDAYPDLKEVYRAKEALHNFYRIRGYHRAKRALHAMLDRLCESKVVEIRTFRRTLLSWRKEILEYFRTGLTNGRVEGYNNKAKLIRKRGYGYRSFKNYRLKVLNACA